MNAKKSRGKEAEGTRSLWSGTLSLWSATLACGVPALPQLVVRRDEVVGEKRGGKGYYPEWHSFLQF